MSSLSCLQEWVHSQDWTQGTFQVCSGRTSGGFWKVLSQDERACHRVWKRREDSGKKSPLQNNFTIDCGLEFLTNFICRLTLHFIRVSYLSSPLFQYDLWKNFCQTRSMEHKFITKVIKLMISIPPNTAWIERAYSKLQIICNVQWGNLLISNIHAEFFMNVLELPVRSCSSGYNGEIELGSHGKNSGEYGALV